MFTVKIEMEIKKANEPFAEFTARYFGMDLSDVVETENLVVGGLLKAANDAAADKSK